MRETRRDVGRWLVEAGPDLDRSGVDDVLLAIREVVTNAVEHAYADGLGPVIVEVELSGASCAVEVRDHGRWCEPRAVDDTRGRGLLIADTLSRGTLRIDRQATGTTVRFAVPVARDQRPGTGAGSRATS